jgi:hypothetical protein
MIEQLVVNGKDAWIKVDPHPVEPENPHIIPTEYFTATYYFAAPDGSSGETIKDEDGGIKLYESPVAAVAAAKKLLEARV